MSKHLIVLTALFAVGCTQVQNGAGGSGSDPMQTNAGSCAFANIDSRCGQTCPVSGDCGTDLYCGTEGVCLADCVAGDGTCPSEQACYGGKCVPVIAATGPAGPTNNECARVDLTVTPQVPTVTLILDRSGSMQTGKFTLANGTQVTRWSALQSALTDPTEGVLPKLENKVRFGAAMYSGLLNKPQVRGACVDLREEDAAISNAADIKSMMNITPDGNTPTGESIEKVVAKLKTTPPPADPAMRGPSIIVLATDGEPNPCVAGQDAKADSVTQVKAAYDASFPTFILSVGSAVAGAHLQDLANVGAGKAANNTTDPAKYYTANSPTDMVDSFNSIIRGARSCQFKINAAVEASAGPLGEVKLNDQPLTYGDANGWTLADPITLELKGAACTTFRNTDSAKITASFPCGAAAIN